MNITKRILTVLFCGGVLFSGVLFGAAGSNTSDDEAIGSFKLADTIVYDHFEGLEESIVDPQTALVERFGAELANEIMNAGPDDLIMFDMVNGDVKVVHGSPERPVAESTEACAPEGRT